MRVDQLVRLLQKLPGDYSVGRMRVIRTDRCLFDIVDEVAVINSTRRVTLGFEFSARGTLEEVHEAFVLREDSK